MQLAILTTDDAPAGSRAVLDGIAADLGLVPNLAASTAASPALLAGFDGLRRAVASAKLDPVLREIAGVAVGIAVDNRYGVAFHSTMLGKLGLPEEQIKLLREGAANRPSAAAAGTRGRCVRMTAGQSSPGNRLLLARRRPGDTQPDRHRTRASSLPVPSPALAPGECPDVL